MRKKNICDGYSKKSEKVKIATSHQEYYTSFNLETARVA